MPMLIKETATINYEVWGERGPWVTLINGYTRPLTDFRLMGRSLNGQGFKVLALDNRGAGATTVSASFRLADMAQDVLDLWGELDVETSHLVGVSMGGFIAQILAANHSSRVERLVLVSTAANRQALSAEETPWTSDVAEVEAKLRTYVTADFAQRNPLLIKSMAKQIARGVEQGRFAANAAMQRDAIKDFDGEHLLGNIRCPTLVVHGSEDRVLPLSGARALAENIASGRLEIVEGAGHLLLAERPKELYQLIGDFLWATV